MAATGNEVVLLRQLKSLYDSIKTLIAAKISSPSEAGTDGQMLVYGDDGNQWVDVPEGTVYSADNATLQLSGTQFSVKNGGITAAKIANGTITADKLASGVIPDVSGFLTSEVANGLYAAIRHYHDPSQISGFLVSRALVSDSSGHPAVSSVTSTELGYLDGVTSGIQTQLDGKASTNHTHAVATTSAAGFMSAADKTKLNGLNNYTLPAATSTTLGGVKIATDTDFETYLGI